MQGASLTTLWSGHCPGLRRCFVRVWLTFLGNPSVLPEASHLALGYFQVGPKFRIRASISIHVCTPIQDTNISSPYAPGCGLCVPPCPPALLTRAPSPEVFPLSKAQGVTATRPASRAGRDPGDLCFSFSKSLLSPGLALNEIICKICFPAGRGPPHCVTCSCLELRAGLPVPWPLALSFKVQVLEAGAPPSHGRGSCGRGSQQTSGRAGIEQVGLPGGHFRGWHPQSPREDKDGGEHSSLPGLGACLSRRS